jgi:hypothetical protein
VFTEVQRARLTLADPISSELKNELARIAKLAPPIPIKPTARAPAAATGTRTRLDHEEMAAEEEVEEDVCKVCSKTTLNSQGEPLKNVLLCEDCDAEVHLRCSSLKTMPSDEESYHCESCASSEVSSVPRPRPPAAAAAAAAGDEPNQQRTNAGMLNDLDTLIDYAKKIIQPASEYLEEHLKGRDLAQMNRMRAAGYFDPLSTTPPSDQGVDDIFSLFKLFKKHPRFQRLGPLIKDEIQMYRTLIEEIPPLAERQDKKGHDTFDIVAWWGAAAKKLPNTALALRGVATHSPNSAPPERVFSILNNSFDDNQTTALNDYVQLSLMLQFNTRGRKVGA